MEKKGFIKRDNHISRYSIGQKFLKLARLNIPSDEVNSCITGELENIADKTNENTFFSIFMPDPPAMFVALEKTALNYATIKPLLYECLNLHVSSSGKAYLGTLSSKDLKSRMKGYDWIKYTNNTISSMTALQKDLSRSKRQGYYCCKDEFTDGLACVSVPISNGDNVFEGALSIVGPSFRLTSPQMTSWSKMLSRSAQAVADCMH